MTATLTGNTANARFSARIETRMSHTLTVEQLAALQTFARENGRNWKSALRHSWETGDYCTNADSASLQQIRNTFGPSWLVRFRLPVDSELARVSSADYRKAELAVAIAERSTRIEAGFQDSPQTLVTRVNRFLDRKGV